MLRQAASRGLSWSAYQLALHPSIERAKVRPATRHTARVLTAVVIAPSGQRLSRNTAPSSGVAELDRAVVARSNAAPYCRSRRRLLRFRSHRRCRSTIGCASVVNG
jgi:hypothetical protein